MNIKLFLVIILTMAVLVYFILPRTKFSVKLKMNTKLFYLTNIIGIVFSLIGLIVSFGWQQLILEEHLFELILLPIVFIYLYTAMIFKVQGTDKVYDEKQNQNLLQAAAITLPISIGTVFFLYLMYDEGILSGLVFFPIILYFSFTVYSASALYYFRNN